MSPVCVVAVGRALLSPVQLCSPMRAVTSECTLPGIVAGVWPAYYKTVTTRG